MKKYILELTEKQARLLSCACDTLRRFNSWRRYEGPVEESPAMPDPKEIGQAIDVAIRELERTTQKEGK